MRFVPSYELNILTDEEFPKGIEKIEAELEACCNSGFFNSFDGKKLYYEFFLAENAIASVVIVHGLSEFTKKFYEISYYFLNMGLNVFVFDQRCHGLSCRLTNERDLIHVDKFEDYVADLSLFIDNVVLKNEDKPLYIYSHSMGGAVSALYLEKNSSKIKKAVLSSPMFEPIVTVVPMPIARGGVAVARFFCGAKKKFPMSKEFNPETPYNAECDQCRVRFEHNMNLRRNQPNYQTTPMSFGWTHGSLTVRRKIMKRKNIKGITAPILLLSSEKDMSVSNEAQTEFFNKCPSCEMVTVKNATHSMLTGYPEILREHITRVISFFKG